MANDNYTTIRIRNDSKRKLEIFQNGRDIPFSDIIDELISMVEGTEVNDVEEINRTSVAFQLEYKNFSTKEYGSFPVFFQELKTSNVGDVFKPPVSDFDGNYVLESAEVLFVDCKSVFVRICRKNVVDGRELELFDFKHIELL